VVVQQLETNRWVVTVGGRAFSQTFPSEPEARAAGEEERLRLDALGSALLRRVRRNLRRKQ
jgi:hypothetical protein